jgi:2,3-bisphosphoglycerate-dependent phosphoglycerate mutase
MNDTLDRLRPYGSSAITPELARGRRVIVSAHGNSLRALVKDPDRLADTEIVDLDIPVSIPLVYELDEYREPVRCF